MSAPQRPQFIAAREAQSKLGLGERQFEALNDCLPYVELPGAVRVYPISCLSELIEKRIASKRDEVRKLFESAVGRKMIGSAQRGLERKLRYHAGTSGKLDARQIANSFGVLHLVVERWQANSLLLPLSGDPSQPFMLGVVLKCYVWHNVPDH